MLVATPYLYALHEITGQKFDLFAAQPAELLRDLYYQAPFINAIMPPDAWTAFAETYQGLIRIDELVLYDLKPELAELAPQLIRLAARGQTRLEEFGLPGQAQPHLNNQLANHAVFWGLDRRSLPLYSAGLEHRDTTPILHLRPDSFDVLDKYELAAADYITIHDGWDASVPLPAATRPTKVWLLPYWQEFVRLVKTDYPHLRIVQLGSLKNGQTVDGVDLDLRGKISIAEALVVLKHSAHHIDTESGLVHFTRALHTPTICLIGPTNAKFFGYARHKNLISDLCANCWWIKNDWMENCLRGLTPPECMASLSPRLVCNSLRDALQTPNLETYQVSPLISDVKIIVPPEQVVAVFNNLILAARLAAGTTVIHFADRLENIHNPTALPYRQHAGNIFNIPSEDAQFDQVWYDAARCPPPLLQYAVKEALRVIRRGGFLNLDLSAHDAACWPSIAAFLKSTAPFAAQLMIKKTP